MATRSSLKVIQDEHRTIAIMLSSALVMVQQGPDADASAYFQALRAMLLYIDEFPERLHHPKETELLFPRIARVVPEAAALIMRLDHDHEFTEKAVPRLLAMLVAWEMIGPSRQQEFVQAFERYVKLYLTHMRQEEEEVLPLAEQHFREADWDELDAAFEANSKVMTQLQSPGGEFDQLFSYIVRITPAPFGLK